MATADLLVASLLPREDPGFCTAHLFNMALARSTSVYLAESTTSYMISSISNIRCWRCSKIPYAPN